MFDPASVGVRGPLTDLVDGFWSELLERRYAPLSARNLLHLAAHLSRWLEEKRLTLGDLTEQRVDEFMARRRREGYANFVSVRALDPLLQYLRTRDLVATQPVVRRETSIDRLLREYSEYLLRERGLVPATIVR